MNYLNSHRTITHRITKLNGKKPSRCPDSSIIVRNKMTKPVEEQLTWLDLIPYICELCQVNVHADLRKEIRVFSGSLVGLLLLYLALFFFLV